MLLGPAPLADGLRSRSPKASKIVQDFTSVLKTVDDLGAFCAVISNSHLVPKFIVSACDGIGCVFIAANALRWERLAAVAIENDMALARAVSLHCPDVVHIADLTAVTAAEIAKFMPAGNNWEFWWVGGPPCQLFSALGAQGLWNDAKSKPLLSFLELRDQLQVTCSRRGVRFRWLMEEVASMPKATIAEISNLAQCVPLLMDAGDFGWVRRPRLWWVGDLSADHAKLVMKKFPFSRCIWLDL